MHLQARFGRKLWVVSGGIITATLWAGSTVANHPESKPGVPLIRVDQVGYPTHGRKVAKLLASPAGPITVRTAKGDDVVLTITPPPPRVDADTADSIIDLDLSGIREPGKYIIEVPGIGKSDVITIGDDPYRAAFRLAMRSYYGQRCGIAVSLAPDSPEFSYPACHAAPATFDPSSGKQGERECAGGWHDAGDYGRYIVNSGITTATLLWAFELNASRVRGVALDIPESGGSLPDTLAEIKWNLDWMLKMQDADGGVWHKATSANFCDFVMPNDDTLPVLIIGNGHAPFKTTAATADFAAVFANAARIYQPFDEPYARRCLAAARLAWSWLEKTPDHNYVDNPPGIHTGGYGDKDCADERLWAAAELFRATGDGDFNQYFLAHYAKWKPTIAHDRVQGWGSVENLAMYAYAMADRPAADNAVQQQIRRDAIAAGEKLIERAAANGYAIPMRGSEYYWGSNSVVANYGIMLCMANRFEPRAAFADAARDALHYLLGRNTFGVSFVTGVGARWPMHPHHRPSGADSVVEPWPGLLVGGPNAEGKPHPARQWVDSQDDFRRNETAINWNAPLVFLLAENLAAKR